LKSDAKQSKVDSDLANRLDTLFDENGSAETSPQTADQSKDPLDELKQLVMSIEWEITDDVMERFLSQVDSLKTRFEEDRILVMFLQLLGSLGLYVKTNKGKAHPNAFKLLNSVYLSFEDATAPGKISPSEKKKLLYVELNKYKELKEQIESSRSPENEPPRMPSPAGVAPQKPDGQELNTGDARQVLNAGASAPDNAMLAQVHFDEVINSLKTLLLKELEAIRKDIARLDKSR
jgi:hypothetical protein